VNQGTSYYRFMKKPEVENLMLLSHQVHAHSINGFLFNKFF